MLEKKTEEQLKALAKDEESYKQLAELFEAERRETERYKEYLSLLESAVRNDYDSIIVTDLEMDKPGPRICYVNDGFEQMTGYSRDEVIGKTPRMLQGEKTDRKTLDRLRKSLEKADSFFGQTVNYRKDGSEYINQWDIHPLTDKSGKVTHWVSYQHDITERKRSERKVLDTNTDFDDLFEESKKAYVDLEADGTLLDSNKAFREMIGYPKEEMHGKKLWEFTPANAVTGIKSVFDDELLDNIETKNSFKVMFRRKNGLPIQTEIHLRLLSIDGKKVLRGSISNLSMRKNVLEILNKRNISFEKVFDRKHDFNYGFSLSGHDDMPDVKWISEGFAPLTGYEADECEGAGGLNKIIHPDDIEIAKAHYRKVKEGRSSTQSFRIITQSGEVKRVMDYSKPDQETDGGYKGSFVAVGKEELKTV